MYIYLNIVIKRRKKKKKMINISFEAVSIYINASNQKLIIKKLFINLNEK